LVGAGLQPGHRTRARLAGQGEDMGLVLRVTLGCILALAAVQEASTVSSFDRNNCSTESPCCVSADDTAKYLGSVMGKRVFCHIEYPVYTTQKWTKKYARTLDDEARDEYETQMKQKGCGIEECTGYVCAKKFPRCFYVNETTRGDFEFEVCRETCEACLDTCKPSEKGFCAANPSQFQLACTSEARSGWRTGAEKLLVSIVILSCLWLATV